MGLDGSVMCNCFGSGLTTEPPVPREWLVVDGEGYLELAPEHDSDEAFALVYAWMQGCCEHPELRQASEHVSNWMGYRLFQQALEGLGWARFPVLHAELPEANGGRTEAARSSLALRELEAFRGAGEMGSNVLLVDSATGATVRERVEAYGGTFIWGGRSGLDAGIDRSGFFLRERDGAELFRSMRFRQTLLNPERDMYGPDPGRVAYLDVDSGREFECRVAISGRIVPWPDGRMEDDRGRVKLDYPAEMRVEAGIVRSSDFDYILGPLERLIRASVETGNPVRWS